MLAKKRARRHNKTEERISMTVKIGKKDKHGVRRTNGKPRPNPQTRSVGHLVAQVRSRLGLSRKLFSRLTGFSERAIANWESGAPPDAPGLRRIRETERFQQRLGEVIQPKSIPEWLDTPNEAFGGLKPLEVIERGEIDRLWNMIFFLESGVSS
jgi:DNA-binding transcriptional regulator YiaG